MGTRCVAALPDRTIVMIDGVGAKDDPTYESEMINLWSHTACGMRDYDDSTRDPDNTIVDMISVFAFDRLLTCGGGLPDATYMSRQCLYLDCG